MQFREILNKYLFIGMVLTVGLSGCEKYVAIDVAEGQLSTEDTYSTASSATAAVLTLYSFYNTTLYSMPYFTVVGSLQADELQYSGSTADYVEFARANITPTNSTVSNYFWYYPYAVIREANLIIDGVTKSATLTDAVKGQLIGEAKFFRALYFYYLVNYFGDVPLSVNTLELANANLPRASTDKVWAQIISDLKDAESGLSAAYANTAYPRTRVNKYSAAALLARVYLYTKDYANAEAEAGKVIGATDVTYSLTDLGSVFISTSPEVILQFYTTNGYSTFFGANYRSSSSTAVPLYTLYPGFTNSFEDGDQRRVQWVDSVESNGALYYKINKYKLATATSGNEYNVVLRLSEQYLIRAEARAAQGTDLSGSASDLNAVRHRAGLGDSPAGTQAALLTAIGAERKVELFGETQRWFDLKRGGNLSTYLPSIKPSYLPSTNGLLPIPVAQLLVNSNLTQNTGY